MTPLTRTVGRYELLREVGRGGMAVVYLAHQVDLGRLVALKELSAFHASDRSVAQRFVRESRVAGALSHPNIVTVHDFFEHEHTPYIAMEYLSRGSLRPFITSLTLAQVVGVLEGVLAGLTHAEQQSVVHRDLKPENLMVAEDGRVKIADFGIAKATNRLQSPTALTVTGTALGTPAYMAPEQAMAQEVGPWTDLYSVGCIAYEMLVGHLPFHGTDSAMALLLKHVNEPVPPPRSARPDLDADLSDWIERLLVKDPRQRIPSAAAAWNELEDIAIRLLGPRWRRDARLPEAGHGGPAAPLTPAAFEAPPENISDEFVSYVPPGGESPARPPVDDTPPPTPTGAPESAPVDDGTVTSPRPAEANPAPAEPAAAPAPEPAPEPTPEPAPEPAPQPALSPTLAPRVRAHRPTALTPAVPPGREFGTGRRRRAALVGSALALLLAIGVGVAVLTRDGGEPPAEPPAEVAVRVVARIPIGPGGGGLPLVAIGAGGIWATNPADGSVRRIDPGTNRAVGTIELKGRDPVDIATSQDPAATGTTPRVWVANTDGTVEVIDAENGRLVGAPIPTGREPSAMALGGGFAWLTDLDEGTVSRISTTTHRPVGRAVKVGRGPTGLTVADGAVWIANHDDGTVSVLDVRTGQAVGRPIVVGAGPSDVRSGFGAIWVSNLKAGTVSRIDPRTRRVTATIKVAPKTLCVSPGPAGVWATAGRRLHRIADDRIVGKPLTVSDREDTCVRGDSSALWVTTRGSGVLQRFAAGPRR